MRFLLNSMIGLIALMLFASAARGLGVGLFDGLFALAGGDSGILSLGFCVVLALFFAACWLWSARGLKRT